MGAPSDYQPIGPGGGKAARLSKRLGQLVWLLAVYLAVYLAIAWWRGEPPSLFTVVNIVGLGAAALGMLGWKGSAETRLTKRLRELFQRGLAPEVEEVMAILEDAHEEDPRRTLTDYYAIGIITPEEYVREMVGLLEIEVPFKGGRAALLLVALCLGASATRADKMIPTLEELVDTADLIAVGEITAIEQVDGWRVGKIEVDRYVSQGGDTVLHYLAEPTWSCDTTRGEVGERYLFLLQRPENNLLYDDLGGDRGVPPTYKADGQILRVAWGGTGQIGIYRDADGERAGLPVSDAAELWGLTRTLGKRPGTAPLDEVIGVIRSIWFGPNPPAEELPEVYKSPADFPELPDAFIEELSARNCLIPRSAYGRPNVISGEFALAGQRDWAVLCSTGGRTRLLVFWGGPASCPEVTGALDDRDLLYEVERGRWEYNVSISTVGRDYIVEHYERYGGLEPPASLGHHGIDQGFEEKASGVHYCHEGRWLELSGAD